VGPLRRRLNSLTLLILLSLLLILVLMALVNLLGKLLVKPLVKLLVKMGSRITKVQHGSHCQCCVTVVLKMRLRC